MVRPDSRKSVYKHSVLWLMLVGMCLMPSYSRAVETALLLQQSPLDGGTVEPGIGVHRLEVNSQVTLRAVPQPGYQFVTWLGDVDDPTSQATMAYMDSPKIVIAVFERTQYESIEAAEILFGFPGGGLRASSADISSGSSSGGSGQRYSGLRFPIQRPEEEEPDDFPTPDSGDTSDFPVPGQTEVPEPATVMMFALCGALMRLRSRKLRM
jgi:hypothetical protein